MKAFLNQNWFKLIIALVILLVGASFFYSYTLRPILNKPKLNKCLEDVKKSASESWKNYCKLDNREIGTDGSCLLPSDRADVVMERADKAKNDCYKKYPQK